MRRSGIARRVSMSGEYRFTVSSSPMDSTERSSKRSNRCRAADVPICETAPGHRVRCAKFDRFPEVK